MHINEEEIVNHISAKPSHLISGAVEELGVEVYVIGGHVRDIFSNRPSEDIDVVAVGSGIESVKRVAKKIRRDAYLPVFKNSGVAQAKAGDLELEFMGARKESYNHDSRKFVVEDGILENDQNRHDFTINVLALCLNKERYGELVDPFDGLEDVDEFTIHALLDSDITFSDNPLRMMRAVRFATQLGSLIDPDTFDAITRNRERISIISKGRIVDELNKIVLSLKPSTGFDLLDKCGLLPLILPEFCASKGVETEEGIGHEGNFAHILMVLDRLSKTPGNLWLRWSALFYDTAKPATKHFDPRLGWTLHDHNFVGERMIPDIFRKMKPLMNEETRYVQGMVSPHMRLIVLSDDGVTDSAIRCLLLDAGDDIDDLMKPCEAGITSKNSEKVRRSLNNFRKAREELADIEEKDRVRNFQSPVLGEEIMETLGLVPSKPVGVLKETIKNAILDGVIPNEHEATRQFLTRCIEKTGLKPIL